MTWLNREDVLTFDSEVLAEDVIVAGNALGRVFVSCDCEDLDLWFRIQDVYPDGRAINMRSPGAEVLRASYRDIDDGRQLLVPGEIHELQLDQLMFANTFRAGTQNSRTDFGVIRTAPVAKSANGRKRSLFVRVTKGADHDSSRRRPCVDVGVARF